MKRILSLVLVLVFAASLMPSALAAAHTITERDVTVYLGDPDVTLQNPYPLYFIDGVDDLPYVNLDEFGEIIVFLNQYFHNDTGYGLSSQWGNGNFVYTRENGYSMQFNFNNGTILFDDYDGFLHNSNDTTLIDLVSEPGFDENGIAQLIYRDTEASFDRYGDVKTIDLAAYGIDIIWQDELYYVPLQTINDLLVYPAMFCGFLYNGEALFYAADDQLFSYEDGDYTDLAELYYSVPQTQRSNALAEYSYSELCLVLDQLYGLKEPHDIQSFSQIFWQIGYDEPLRGSDPVDADRALKSFIDYYLDDLHSVFNEYSPLSGLLSITSSTGMANRKIDENSALYSYARGDDWDFYEEVGNTAYITFDVFKSDYYGSAFYEAKETGEILEDTIGLIIYAHSRITRENSPIENVVLDLSNNSGGAVDAAVFVLGWFLGDASFSVKNMSTGAMSTSVYRADVNLDRQFDERDTVADKNLYCLISPVSFSCGNLVPAALKSSQKVTLIGRTTGGGSCVVQPLSTAYGTVFQISSAWRMSFLKNGSFYDIDQGIDPDIYIDRIENLYNREALTDFINNLF